jgi:crossover junction endodeoxyribonuclease RuvC
VSISGKEKIILGIDPGTQVMGYGVLSIKGSQYHILQFGVVHLQKYNNHALKLKHIYDQIITLIDEYHPDEVALEAPFYGKNVQSMLKLGRAQGVAMAAALSRDLPINEYAPKKVKQAVTGNGNASKEQVADMLKQLLGFREAPALLDATDGLAVALCHHFQGGQIQLKSGGWNAFLRENPDRVK